MIRLTGLSKSFGATKVLDGIDLDLRTVHLFRPNKLNQNL